MVDYSKWKDIEISDDEDDTHPNIDTPSLFRWRHQARVERMEEAEREKQRIEAKKREAEKKLKEIKEKAQKSEGSMDEVKSAVEELEKELERTKQEEDLLKKKEQHTPWNVDTISKPGFQKTVINKKAIYNEPKNMSEEEKEQNMKEFVKKHEKTIKQFGMLRKYDDSRKFLMENHKLVCDDTANYLVIWCINLEMEEKHELMSHVAHQCICLQYILDIAKQLDVDPRGCVDSFFQRLPASEIEYKKQFDSEIEEFKERIRKRAAEKIKEALAEQEEEERKARLGPGGLDPVEVFETLPKELQSCFESRDIGLLQETIKKLPEDEARYHMKRCVDSGLWVPDANKKGDDEEEGGEEEEIYDTADDEDKTEKKEDGSEAKN